jgi:hypothetical protein
MGDLARLLSIFVAVALLAFSATACGDDDGSGSAATQPEAEAAKPNRSKGTANGDTASEDETKSDARSGDGGGEQAGGSGDSSFVPKQHDDSGGGSAQFRVKGGDNSVQEFGQEADGFERAEAATALHDFLDARASEDWQSACSILTKEIRKSLEELARQGGQVEDTSCAGILAKLTNRAALPALRSEAARADVGSLRIEGDRAFILYRSGDTVLTVPMANEDGGWKVASLAGSPLN